MKKIQVPVAYCALCEETRPVVVQDVPVDDTGKAITVVYCPGCEQLINTLGDIDIKWYTPEELQKATGWAVTQ